MTTIVSFDVDGFVPNAVLVAQGGWVKFVELAPDLLHTDHLDPDSALKFKNIGEYRHGLVIMEEHSPCHVCKGTGRRNR